MIILERNIDKPPNVPPLDPEDVYFWESQFPRPIEPCSNDLLVGRVILEDCVAAAEARLEKGLSLSGADRSLLELSREYVDDIYDEV